MLKRIYIDFDYTLFNVFKFVQDRKKGSLTDGKYSKYLYSDAAPFINYAKKFGTPYIFSEGEVGFQKEKIFKTGINQLFGDNLKIYGSYEKMLQVRTEDVKDKVILVDDNPETITEALKLGWKAIRIKRGKYKEGESMLKPDYTVTTLKQIVENNLLSKL